jgi:hypothetical protein
MIGSPLSGNGGGEEEEIAQSTEFRDKRVGAISRQMLGNFKTHCQIKTHAPDGLIQLVLLQVAWDEQRSLDQQSSWVNVVAIEAGYPVDSKFQSCAEPGPNATTNIND